MSSLEWALLERFVGADAWLRLAAPAAMQPVATVLLVALVGGLILAIARAGREVAAVTQIAVSHSVTVSVPSRRPPDPAGRTAQAPVGGRGPRAPGRPRRRPVIVATAI